MVFSSVRTGVPLCLLLICCHFLYTAMASYSITGPDYVFQLNSTNNKPCLYASFLLNFTIHFTEKVSRVVQLPERSHVRVGGECNSTLVLHWSDNGSNYSTTWIFSTGNDWSLQQIIFNFTFDSSEEGSAYEGSSSTHEGVQSFATLDTKLFNRTFTKNDYFYCERCRTYNFNHSDDTQDSTSAFPHPCLSHNNGSSETCSHVDMAEAVIYLGDISADKPNKKLCIADYIALQEIIVPIVVGGILGLLLILIFVAYIIAYLCRRRKDSRSQYEPVGDY